MTQIEKDGFNKVNPKTFKQMESSRPRTHREITTELISSIPDEDWQILKSYMKKPDLFGVGNTFSHAVKKRIWMEEK